MKQMSTYLYNSTVQRAKCSLKSYPGVQTRWNIIWWKGWRPGGSVTICRCWWCWGLVCIIIFVAILILLGLIFFIIYHCWKTCWCIQILNQRLLFWFILCAITIFVMAITISLTLNSVDTGLKSLMNYKSYQRFEVFKRNDKFLIKPFVNQIILYIFMNFMTRLNVNHRELLFTY